MELSPSVRSKSGELPALPLQNERDSSAKIVCLAGLRISLSLFEEGSHTLDSVCVMLLYRKEEYHLAESHEPKKWLICIQGMQHWHCNKPLPVFH